MTPADKAKELLELEVYYWGQKGLETTQRCAINTSKIRKELIGLNVEDKAFDYWTEVLKEIYKQGL